VSTLLATEVPKYTEHFSQDRDQDQGTKNAPRDRLETKKCLETSDPCKYT